MRIKSNPKIYKSNKTVMLPDINKDKIKKIGNKKGSKNSHILYKLGSKQLLDSFGFSRRMHKSKFLY